MDSDLDRAKKDALSFLERHKLGVLATASADGNIHARTIFYTADEQFNIYFLTRIDTRKYQHIVDHPQVAITISATDFPQTLQIEGMAMDISLDEEAAKKKEELSAVLNSNMWFPPPISKLDPAEVVLMWIRPTWIRWADYAFADKGTEHVFKEFTL